MLNEPFRIPDNIPLIWCFASFETYQSRVLEIVTQKQGLADAPQPTQQVFSALACLHYVCPLIHFHTNCTQLRNLYCICIPTYSTPRHRNRHASVCRGGEKKWELKSEEGVQILACSWDTWSLSWEEILEAEGGWWWWWRYVINFALVPNVSK